MNVRLHLTVRGERHVDPLVSPVTLKVAGFNWSSLLLYPRYLRMLSHNLESSVSPCGDRSKQGCLELRFRFARC